MEVTIKQLRMQPGRIISQIDSVQEITITYRGKSRAKIVPITGKKDIDLQESENELFGIWKDRKDIENVEEYVRNLRRGRKL